MSLITPDQSRQARRELGLSQATVADATGLNRQYISEFESGYTNRLTNSHLRKLRAFYEAKIEEAREAGDEIIVTFGTDSEPESEDARAPAIETVKAKRFFFPVDDEVADEVLAKTVAAIRTNDQKLTKLLSMVAERKSAMFGDGDYTDEVQQAFRDAFSLLSANYLLIRAVGGWPEVGLTASNADLNGDSLLSAIVGQVADTFEQAGLLPQEEEVEQ